MRNFRLSLALALAASCAAQVRYEDILQGPTDNWLTYAGDYQARRHSPLKQITVDNAASLAPKWVYHVPKASGLRTNPIVYNGVMYITNTNEVRARVPLGTSATAPAARYGSGSRFLWDNPTRHTSLSSHSASGQGACLTRHLSALLAGCHGF